MRMSRFVVLLLFSPSHTMHLVISNRHSKYMLVVSTNVVFSRLISILNSWSSVNLKGLWREHAHTVKPIQSFFYNLHSTVDVEFCRSVCVLLASASILWMIITDESQWTPESKSKIVSIVQHICLPIPIFSGTIDSLINWFVQDAVDLCPKLQCCYELIRTLRRWSIIRQIQQICTQLLEILA